MFFVATICGLVGTFVAMTTLAARIVSAREGKGLSQEQLAEMVGMTQQGIAAIEGNKSKNPQKLRAIARALGVTEEHLRGEDTDDLTPPLITTLVPGAQLVSPQKMPVYAAAQGGDGHIIVSFEQIDEIKRPAELENVKGGYGLLIKGSSMVPALWEGDMALVNPHLPPAREFNHIFYHEPPNSAEVEAIVKQLEAFNDRDWTVKQWNPLKEWKESRQVWQVCHRVVGKYDRR